MQFTALTLLLRLGLGVSSLAIYPPNRNETNFIENRGGTRTDPSGQPSQSTNRQNDGTGRYVGTCGDSGKGDSHCWTDVYAVQYQTPWQPWEAVSRGFTRSDQPCSTTHINAKQACISQETSTSFSAGIDDEVLKIGAEVSHTEGSSQCTTSQNNHQCSCMSPSSAFQDRCTDTLIRDKNTYHEVSATHQYVRAWGYNRRTCISLKHQSVKDVPKRSDGCYT